MLVTVRLAAGFCRLEGFFAFNVQYGDGASAQIRAGNVQGAVRPFATDAEVDAAVACQLAALQGVFPAFFGGWRCVGCRR